MIRKQPGLKERVKSGDMTPAQALAELRKRATSHATRHGSDVAACIATAMQSRTGKWIAARMGGGK